MKSLVVFYSLDGHTRLIADIIAKETGADVYELKTVKPSTGKSGFAKFFLGGMRVNMNQKPALKDPLPDMKDYELVYIGTPVWASGFTPAVNTFVSRSNLCGKKIMLFSSSGGGDAGQCFEKLKKRLPGSQFLGELSMKQSSFDNVEELNAKVRDWLAGTCV